MKPSVRYSCVLDDAPKFVYQLWVWIVTLTELGGLAPSDLFVHLVRRDAPQTAVEALLNARGIAHAYVPPFGDGRFCNKLQQLATPALREREYAVLTDTDIAFTAALDPWIGLGAICAKEVDFANPPVELLEPLYRRAGFTHFPERKRCTFADADTYVTNCNGGVYVLRTALFDTLLPRWKHWAIWTLDQGDLLGLYVGHVCQISFSLAVWEMGETIVPLPRIANFPTHVPPECYDPHNDVPLSLHYHDRVQPDGGLCPVGVPLIDARIAHVNALLARTPMPPPIADALRAYAAKDVSAGG